MPDDVPPPVRRLSLAPWVAVALLVFGAAAGVLLARPFMAALPSLPPASSSTTLVRSGPSVLAAVRDLKRLEGASFHMERVRKNRGGAHETASQHHACKRP